MAYFKELKRIVKERVTLQVSRKPSTQSPPSEIFGLAQEERGKYRDKNDSVWVLLDLEGDQHQQAEVVALQQQGQARRVQVALSKPCYEVWTLLHVVDTGETFADCTAVLNRLRQEWRNHLGQDFPNKKAQADYSKILPHRGTAAARARQRRERPDPSWTEVFLLIEEIDRYVSDASAPPSPPRT